MLVACLVFNDLRRSSGLMSAPLWAFAARAARLRQLGGNLRPRRLCCERTSKAVVKGISGVVPGPGKAILSDDARADPSQAHEARAYMTALSGSATLSCLGGATCAGCRAALGAPSGVESECGPGLVKKEARRLGPRGRCGDQSEASTIRPRSPARAGGGDNGCTRCPAHLDADFVRSWRPSRGRGRDLLGSVMRADRAGVRRGRVGESRRRPRRPARPCRRCIDVPRRTSAPFEELLEFGHGPEHCRESMSATSTFMRAGDRHGIRPDAT